MQHAQSRRNTADMSLMDLAIAMVVESSSADVRSSAVAQRQKKNVVVHALHALPPHPLHMKLTVKSTMKFINTPYVIAVGLN